MNRFEPPPLPGEHRSEPTDPYAPPAEGAQPPSYGQQQAYGQGQPYGYGAAPQAAWGAPALAVHPKGTTVLVLGILSVVLIPLLGPFAWLMGRSALKEVDASPQPVSNRSVLVAGMVLGIIGTVFMVLGVLVFVLFFSSIMVMSTSTSV